MSKTYRFYRCTLNIVRDIYEVKDENEAKEMFFADLEMQSELEKKSIKDIITENVKVEKKVSVDDWEL